MRLDEDMLREVFPRFLKDGWQVVSLFPDLVSTSRHLHPYYQNVHTLEAALRDVNVTALRPRLEHAQILREQDMIRVGRLGGASALSRLDQSTV